MKIVKKTTAFALLSLVLISFAAPFANATKDKPFEIIREYRAMDSGGAACPLGGGLCNF